MTAFPTAAQQNPGVRAQLPPGAVVQSLDDGPAGALRRSLTALGENPRSLSALINAGRAALELGDPQAALTFFSRAEEVAPTDPRVKAGMGSAMVQVGQPRAGLNLFAEALALGAPEIEIAADRGLAHDLTGDPRRAQQDYALALRSRDDAEVRRRMALSLAITGQRDAALRLIDPQLRRNERAAWRTQTFILALTGDAAAASRTARNIMPGGIGDAMAPFLSRLAQLSPAQKAMAVHLGQFPSDGRPGAMAGNDIRPDPGALAMAQGREPAPAAAPPRATVEERPGERRRPGTAPVSPLERAAVGGRQSPSSSATRFAEVAGRQPPARMPARVPDSAAGQPAANSPLPVADRTPRQAAPTAPLRVAETDTSRFNLAPTPSRPAQSGPIVVPPAAGATVMPRFGTTPLPATSTPPGAVATPPATGTAPAVAQQPIVTGPSSPVNVQGPPTLSAPLPAAQQPIAAAAPPTATTAQPLTMPVQSSLTPVEGTLAGPATDGATPPPPALPTGASASGAGSIQTTDVAPSTAQMSTPSQPAETSPIVPPSSDSAGLALNPVPVPNSASPPAGVIGQPDSAPAQPTPPPADAAASAAPGFSLAPAPGRPATATPAPARQPLADIAALVRTLPRDERTQLAEATPRPTRPTSASPRAGQAQQPPQTGRNARAEANAAGTRNPRARTPAPPAHPSRHWVQVAGGANRTALPREFARLRTLAPQLLGRREAYTTPLRATNRLLVGPFRSEAEALAFVNQLRRAEIPAFAWTSEAGQEIERLQMPR